ncbi:hypothetical protein GF402_11870 [Candidatus Fermentibacteria bacterium]|nr:hypothetical protein [Candidatus Fermentibacteria bacterium]
MSRLYLARNWAAARLIGLWLRDRLFEVYHSPVPEPTPPPQPPELVCEPDADYVPWQDDVPEMEIG